MPDPNAVMLLAIGQPVQLPIAVVKINGEQILNPISVDVTLGMEQQSSTASVRLAADAYPSLGGGPSLFGAILQVRLGYGRHGGVTVLVFEGDIEDTDTKFAPYFVELKASGYLKRMQHVAGNTDPLSGANDPVREWNGATDSQIWNDLMALGNVPRYTAGSGDSRTIGGPVKLMPGDNIRSKIDDLDHASESGQRTFEYGGQVYRVAALRVPMSFPTWRYIEGEPSDLETAHPVWPVYSMDRQQSDRDVKNQAIVQGRQAAGTDNADVVGAVRQETSAYWGTDGSGNPIFVPFSFQSDFLETREQCDAVAQRYMYEHNKVTDVVHMRTPLNPLAMPARTVGVISTKLGLYTMFNYWVRDISHHWGAEGATTEWTLEGGAGPTGYLVGLPPIALFEMVVTRESWQTGIYDAPTTFYTAVCDGSASHDPDNTALTFAWTSSNGATGTGVIFTVAFTQAQIDDTTTPAMITLVVTDSDSPTAHTSAPNEQSVSGVTGDVKTLGIYVAALGVCHATPDGWETIWQWTPPSDALCCCRIASGGTNYFGLANGAIYRTDNYLSTAPTLVWTGGASVTAMWMSELDTTIIAIGLSNGEFYVTKDQFATLPVLYRNFGNPIQWINGSNQVKTQWRACVGQDVWYTDNDFIGAHVLVSFGGMTIRQNELTAFSNYACAQGSGNLIKRENDGFPIAFPSVTPAPTDSSMTAFIDTDELLVGDDQGRSYISVPASLGTTMVQKTSIGLGAVNDLLRDNTNFAAAYAACDTGVAKTFDKAESWHRVITYNGTTTKGLMLGYDSAPLAPIVALADQQIEACFTPNTSPFADFPPNDNPNFHLGMDLWNPLLGPAGDGSRNDPPPSGWYLPSFAPTAYTPAGTTHNWLAGEDGIINNPGGGQQMYFDRAAGTWIKSPYTGTGVPSGWSGTPGPGSHPACVFRHEFTLPAMSVGSARIMMLRSSIDILGIYVNGTAIAGPPYTSAPYLATSLFIADGVTKNLVAVHAKFAAFHYAPQFAYKIEFGGGPFVSLFQDSVTGLLVWGSTGEGYCVAATSDPAGWYNIVTGAVVGGSACGNIWPPDFYTGMYAFPWPTLSQNGKKLGNMNGYLTAPPSGTTHLYYHTQHIDLPAGADTAWRVRFHKHRTDMIVYDIYLNGTRLATPTPASPAGDESAALIDYSKQVFSFDVPAGTMIMGGRNTIGFKVGGGTGIHYSPIAWYMVQV